MFFDKVGVIIHSTLSEKEMEEPVGFSVIVAPSS